MYTENSTPANKQLLIKKIFTTETKKIAGIIFNDDFKLFITEHLMIGRWNNEIHE